MAQIQIPQGFAQINTVQPSVLDSYLKLKNAREETKLRQQEMELRTLQMQNYQSEMAARTETQSRQRGADQTAQQEKRVADAKAAVLTGDPEMMRPFADVFGKMLGRAPDDPEVLDRLDPKDEHFKNLEQWARGPQKPVNVAAGGKLVDPGTGELIVDNPKAPTSDKPSALQKDTEWLANLMGITDDKQKADLALSLKGKGITVKTNPDGSTEINIGGIGKDGPTQAQMTQQNQLWQEYDTTIAELEKTLAEIEKDPSLVGAVGSIRKGAQTTVGVVKDLSKTVPGMETLSDLAGRIVDSDEQLSSEQKKRFANDPKISKLRLFENNVGLALARTRVPTGRIPVDIIDRSIKDAQLTGLTSSADVINRVKEILATMKNNRKDVEQVMAGERDAKPKRKRYVPGQGIVEVAE